MNYICSVCKDERRFVDLLEHDAYNNWSIFTLGLSTVIKFFLSQTVLKPICIECGNALKRSTQSYLAESHYSHRNEMYRSSPHEERVPYKVELIKKEGTVPDRWTQKKRVEKRRTHERLKWNENAGTSVRVHGDNDELVAKCPTDFTYYSRAFLLDQASGVVLHQATIGGGWFEKITLFKKASFCLFPWGLPRWEPVVSFPFPKGLGYQMTATEVEEDKAVVYAGNSGICYVSAKYITTSFSAVPHENEEFRNLKLNWDNSRVLILVVKYDILDRSETKAVRVIHLKSKGENYDIPIELDQINDISDNGEVLILKEKFSIRMYDIESGLLVGVHNFSEGVGEIQFNAGRSKEVKIGDTVFELNHCE